MDPRIRRRVRHVVNSAIAFFVTAIFFFPIYWALSTSLRNPKQTFTVAGLGIPWVNFQPTFDNWVDQLSTGNTQLALLNSLIIAGGATLVAMGLGLPAAYSLARFKFPRLDTTSMTVFFLSQRVLPPVAVVIPFYLIARQLGLLDSRIALIALNAMFILPFVVVIMRQTFMDLPIELEEAAKVDGAKPWQAFFIIALPLALPALAATGLIIFAFAWNEFLFAMALAGNNAKPITVHMAGAVDTRGVQFWFMAVRACIALIPPVVLALIAQRYIVRGLTLGAVRG
ncbi:MAG: carbohydrate ABC transporter permease [Azospirillaceae bacterium]